MRHGMMFLLICEHPAKPIIPFLCAFGTYTHKKEKHCPLRAEKPVRRRKQGLNKNRNNP